MPATTMNTGPHTLLDAPTTITRIQAAPTRSRFRVYHGQRRLPLADLHVLTNGQDYPWTGLIYCAPNQWYAFFFPANSLPECVDITNHMCPKHRVACKEEGKPDTIRVGDRCECPTATESITAAFTAAPVIPNVGKLPMTLGGRIEWENGHFPTSRPAASTTSIEGEFTTSAPTSTSTFSSTTSTTASNTSLPTTTQSPTSSPSDSGRHLSTGAKAGIGIVSVFGAMLLFGALSALWMIWRRRLTKKNVSDQNESCGDAAAGAGTGYDGGGGKNPAPMMALAEMPSPSVPQRPAEMPTPNVPPRPTESGLGMGPWMVVPDGPQGPAYPSGAYGPWPYAAGGEKDWESQGSVQPQPAGYSQGQAESHHSGQWVPREEEKPRHPAIELPG